MPDEQNARIAPAKELPSLDSDFASMSDEELEAGNKALQAERTRLGEVQDALCEVRNRRSNEAQAEAKLAGMSEGELNVLIEAATARLSLEAKAPGE